MVHLAQPPLVNVHDAAFNFLPHAVGKIAAGILERFRNGEMLLECDLALHAPPLQRRRDKKIGRDNLILARHPAVARAGIRPLIHSLAPGPQ